MSRGNAREHFSLTDPAWCQTERGDDGEPDDDDLIDMDADAEEFGDDDLHPWCDDDEAEIGSGDEW